MNDKSETGELLPQERGNLESTRSYVANLTGGGSIGGALKARLVELIAIVDRLSTRAQPQVDGEATCRYCGEQFVTMICRNGHHRLLEPTPTETVCDQITWRRINDEPYEYAIQRGFTGDEFVKLLSGEYLRRAITKDI